MSTDVCKATIPPTHLQTSTHVGFLDKKGKVHTAWKRRWFVLKGDRLLYFTTKDQKKHNGYIMLNQAVIKVTTGEQYEHTFSIGTKDRVFQLAAPSKSELAEWVQILVPLSTVHSENKVVEDLQKSIEHSAMRRAEKENELFNKEFEDLQLTTNRSSTQLEPEEDIDGNDDSDSGDGELLERDRQEMALEAQSQAQGRARTNSFLEKPKPTTQPEEPRKETMAVHRQEKEKNVL